MSILYDGGGTNNDMQVDTTIAEVIASTSGDIDTTGVNFIDIQLISAAAGDTATVAVLEFSATTPTVATLIRVTEVPVSATDLVVDGDLLMADLSTASAYLKQPFRVQLSHTTNSVKLSLSAETAGAKYIRYALGSGMVTSSQMTVDNLDLDIGNVGLLDAADGRISPAESRVSNVAFAAGDNLAPLGAVRKNSPAQSEAVAANDWGSLIMTATSELWTSDYAGNVLLGTIDANAGAVADALITAGAVGTLASKLRSISRELGTIDADTDAIKTAVESMDAETKILTGDAVTYTTVLLNSAAAGRLALGGAAGSGAYTRLHALHKIIKFLGLLFFLL